MMERWENRYANGRKGGKLRQEHSRLDRFLIPASIVMAIVLVALVITTVQSAAFRGEAKDMMIARAITECSDAVNHVNNLSRTNGSDTMGTLGKIRANIKAVDVLSNMRQTLFGRPLAPQSTFTELYAIIDSYSAKYLKGSVATEELTNLGAGLTNLQNLLQEVR